jgi:hypothetical protein
MIPAALMAPLARYAAPLAIAGGLFAWAWLERAGRHVAAADAALARQEVAALQVRIRHMETRRVEEDRANREPNPVGRLRDEWSRD